MITENQRKIKALREYVDICKEMEEVREYYMCKAYSIQSQIISDMPMSHGSAGDVVGSKLAKIDSIDEMINKRLLKLEEKCVKVELIIDTLEESIHRRLMHMRYIQGLGWEQISVNINYAWRHVHRLHSEALKSINVD